MKETKKNQETKYTQIELHVGIIYCNVSKASFAAKDGFSIDVIPNVGFSIFKDGAQIHKGVPFNQVKSFEFNA